MRTHEYWEKKSSEQIGEEQPLVLQRELRSKAVGGKYLVSGEGLKSQKNTLSSRLESRWWLGWLVVESV